MTLLELVVALAITGMAVSAGYGTFANLSDRRDAAAEGASTVLREAGGRAAVVRWLSAARLTVQDDGIQFRGIDGVTREGHADDDVLFFTTAPTLVSSEESTVRLYIDRDTATAERGLVAELREREGSRTMKIELVPNAISLDGTYLTSLFGQRQWLGSWVSTSVLPAGTRLVAGAAAGDSLPPLWRLPVTVSIEGAR
jgi:hypothetical protein